MICGYEYAGRKAPGFTPAEPGSVGEVYPSPDGVNVTDALCPFCWKKIDNGQSAFWSENGRAAILTREATQKLQPEYRGKVIRVPAEVIAKMLRKANQK